MKPKRFLSKKKEKIAAKVGSVHWNKTPPPKSFRKIMKESLPPYTSPRSKFLKCPGCHSTMENIRIFGDGFKDQPPDVWFHCTVCGEEDCVDLYGDNKLDGSRNPTKNPPFQNDHPLPQILPIVGTPDQIREYSKTHGN